MLNRIINPGHYISTLLFIFLWLDKKQVKEGRFCFVFSSRRIRSVKAGRVWKQKIKVILDAKNQRIVFHQHAGSMVREQEVRKVHVPSCVIQLERLHF